MSRDEYDRKCIELQICLRKFREHSANARAAAKAKADLYFNGILPALVKENSFRKKEAEAREKLEKTKERLKKIQEEGEKEDVALAILRKKMAAMDILSEEIENGLINSEEAYQDRYLEIVGEPFPQRENNMEGLQADADENKRSDLKISKYSATEAFQTLIEISAAVFHGGLTPASHGLVFHEKIGEILAKHLIEKKAGEDIINFYADILYDFCSLSALMRFVFEVEGEGFSVPYDFENGDEFVIKGHKGLNHRAAMDIEAMARRGKQLGWKGEWCPFEKPYSDMWWKGFSKEEITLIGVVVGGNLISSWESKIE